MPTPTALLELTPRARRGGALVATALAGVLCVLIASPPFLGEAGRTVIMQAFHAVCHQLPERSFHVSGEAMAVCHRCTGIYAGLLMGALLFPLLARADAFLWHHSRLLLGLSLLPMAVDWTGDALGLFANTPVSQATTGLVFGFAAAYLLARGLAGLFAPRPQRATVPSAA